MLSSVLNSERAISVNIQIMRTFTNLREFLATHRLAERVDSLERGFKRHDAKIRVIFSAIRSLLLTPEKPEPKTIGFRP